MNMIDIINKKRLKQDLTKEEFQFVIDGYLNKEIPDYQVSALLMAICLNGMTYKETSDLTGVMLKSGDQIDLSKIKGRKVDKHSTGGVGDKITLILGPLVASCGVKVAKMSGRGLGHTGGTIDKLESIPGFQVELKQEEFINQVNKLGFALVSQSGNLVPADKKLYALRDVTGTVESIPLIASSIMSKKCASGADKIVIDVKVGEGALVKTLEDARTLAQYMVHIGKEHGKETVCVLTRMSEPLGLAIGNALEVQEAMDVLQDKGPEDVKKIVIELGKYMVSMGLDISLSEAEKLVKSHLKDGSAYDTFLKFVKAQGGDIEKLSFAPKVFSIKSSKNGIVNHIDAYKLGILVHQMGAGRDTLKDEIDYGVGIVLSKKVGDFVLENEELMKVYLNKKDVKLNDLINCFSIENDFTNQTPLIYEVIK